MKIIAFLINAIFWLELFIVPASILSIAGLWLYFDKNINLFFAIALGAIGVISGIALAEYVRKRYGLDNFWAGISSAPVDKNEEDIST